MLRPKISLTVGNKLYDQHTLALRLRRTQLPALDRLEVALPAAVQFDAAAGDDCSLEIDGGDGAATVFTGTLTKIRRAFTGLCLTAHNGGLALARYRPAASYEQLNAGEIIDNFCGDVSVSVAKRVDGPALALYVADGRASAAEEIARLALMPARVRLSTAMATCMSRKRVGRPERWRCGTAANCSKWRLERSPTRTSGSRWSERVRAALRRRKAGGW
jgi:hypothetical protein